MATRTAVLIGERDERIGTTTVPDIAVVIRHDGDIYVRTTEGIRLTRGGLGVGAVFRLAEVFDRPRLQGGLK